MFPHQVPESKRTIDALHFVLRFSNFDEIFSPLLKLFCSPTLTRYWPLSSKSQQVVQPILTSHFSYCCWHLSPFITFKDISNEYHKNIAKFCGCLDIHSEEVQQYLCRTLQFQKKSLGTKNTLISFLHKLLYKGYTG